MSGRVTEPSEEAKQAMRGVIMQRWGVPFGSQQSHDCDAALEAAYAIDFPPGGDEQETDDGLHSAPSGVADADLERRLAILLTDWPLPEKHGTPHLYREGYAAARDYARNTLTLGPSMEVELPDPANEKPAEPEAKRPNPVKSGSVDAYPDHLAPVVSQGVVLEEVARIIDPEPFEVEGTQGDWKLWENRREAAISKARAAISVLQGDGERVTVSLARDEAKALLGTVRDELEDSTEVWALSMSARANLRAALEEGEQQ